MSLSDDIKEEYQEYAEQLKQQRGEIEVKLHLLEMDAKDEWQELEKKYQHLTAKLKNAAEAAEESSGDIKEAAKLLVEELKAGYKRIKSRL